MASAQVVRGHNAQVCDIRVQFWGTLRNGGQHYDCSWLQVSLADFHVYSQRANVQDQSVTLKAS